MWLCNTLTYVQGNCPGIVMNYEQRHGDMTAQTELYGKRPRYGRDSQQNIHLTSLRENQNGQTREYRSSERSPGTQRLIKINLQPCKAAIPHPRRLSSLTFDTTLVPVINCFKKFTFSLPLEPWKHKLELRKSVRGAELSIYRALIYTVQMGDYSTAVKR